MATLILATLVSSVLIMACRDAVIILWKVTVRGVELVITSSSTA